MPIVDYRIDDRLIHGQVCGFWVPHHSVNKILIVDDEIINNPIRMTALKVGCPTSCGLVIKGISDAASLLKKYNGNSRLLILVNSPAKYLGLSKEGISIPYITIGNMSKKDGSTQIRNTVFITENDKQAFIELANNGTKLYGQMVPEDPREDITNLFM